jgi:hypothetical protein
MSSVDREQDEGEKREIGVESGDHSSQTGEYSDETRVGGERT